MKPELQGLLSDPVLSLPLVYQDDQQTHYQLVSRHLNAYVRLLVANRRALGGLYRQGLRTADTVERGVKLCGSGQPGSAFSELRQFCLEEVPSLSNWPQRHYGAGSAFYRVRSAEFGREPFSRNELFHHAFNLDGKVGTQRFSVPGYPCLYVGNTLCVCCLEVGCLQGPLIRTVQLEAQRPFRVVDLSPDVFYGAPVGALPPLLASQYLLLWPLVAACSVRVRESRRADSHKPEYPFPQLVLQHLMRFFQETLKREGYAAPLLGIRYLSTRPRVAAPAGDFENLVLPPFDYQPGSRPGRKYSRLLCRTFHMSDVTEISRTPANGWRVDGSDFPDKALYSGVLQGALGAMLQPRSIDFS